MTCRIVFAGVSALALLVATATAAGAADAESKGFVVAGSAPQVCDLGGFTATILPAVASYNDASGTLTFSLDADGDTQLDGFTIELTATASCNFKNKVTLTSDNSGLFNRAAGGGGFTDRVDYLATVTWDTVSVVSLDTSGSPGTSADGNTSGAVSGDLVVKIQNTTTPGTLLLAGSFEDTLTLSIGNDI